MPATGRRSETTGTARARTAKPLQDFDFDARPAIDRKLVEELATLRFVEEKANVLLVGPPGVGKTMLAVCLGRLAVQAGYRVYYTTAAELAARCQRAALEGRWATTMRFYAGPGLLICDELGYLPLPKDAAVALFQVVSERYLKGSIVLTTNRGIGPAWGQMFEDTVVAAAMLDRLLHHSTVLQITTSCVPTALASTRSASRFERLQLTSRVPRRRPHCQPNNRIIPQAAQEPQKRAATILDTPDHEVCWPHPDWPSTVQQPPPHRLLAWSISVIEIGQFRRSPSRVPLSGERIR